MVPRSWKVTTFCLFVGCLSLLGYLVFSSRASRRFAPDTVITQVQKLSQLVTVRYRIQRVVGMTEAKEPVGEESILLMVEGEVQAGVDLQHLTTADVTASHGGLTLMLPPASILSASLDESKTKVWDRHITWWTPWVPYDPDLEHKARLKAAEDIRKAALEMGILDQARNNARTALQDLFATLGWRVNVKVRGLD